MLKANELRIGNYVYAFGTTWQVDNTCFSSIDKIETYKPILLTEEWLLKLGFQKQNRVEFFGIGYSFDNLLFDDKLNLHRPLKLNIKYVHQLQNLYFAITGEELTTTTE